jgi:hypothetical protein
MNVEIGTETAHCAIPEKEYINGIFLAVHARMHLKCMRAVTTVPLPTAQAISRKFTTTG